MGVVNVTPDSFSDGGAFLDPAELLVGRDGVGAGARRLPADVDNRGALLDHAAC